MTSVDTPLDGHDPVDAAAREDLRGLFELEQVHRRGPVSLVCLARDLEYNQPVALKIMPRAPAVGADAEEAFHRAAALAAALDHPHIVPLYSAGATDRFFWCAMQYVEGRSLADALRSSVPMEPPACLRVVGQVVTALDFAHRLAVVHAGLTPANVLLDASGDAHVTDFWIPWVLERLGALPGDGGKAQRAKYRAPEQVADGRCGPEADQYALAALLQACLMKTSARVPPPPDLGRAIERALSPAPENRFSSLHEFAVVLGAAEVRPSGRAARLVPYEDADYPEQAPQPTKWRWVPAGVLTLAVLGAVAAPWLLSRGSTADRRAGTESAYLSDSFARPDSTPSLSIADSLAPADMSPPPMSTPAPSLPLVASPLPRRTPGKTAPVARPAPRVPRAKAVSPPVERLGHLFINATPWGQVYLDGELLGNTPRVDAPVSPGPHRLRVVRDGFQPYEIAIRVQPGQELRITDIVLQEVKQ